MKFFKKALIATAILGSVGAQAATVSSTALKLSKEGVQYKVQPVLTTLTFDIVVDKNHPSASTITLAFDKNVDISNVAACTSVTQGVSAGKAVCGDIGFDYGTGSFTFDNVVLDTSGTTDKLSFKVNLGNPLYADSAFRVVLGEHNYDMTATGDDSVYVYGESDLSYSSVDGADAFIEDGKGPIAVEETQFTFAVTHELDGLVKRITKDSFVDSNSDNLSPSTDVSNWTFVNNGANQILSLVVTGAEVNYAGNFKGVSAWSTNTTDVGSLFYANTGSSTTTNEVSVDLFSGYTPWATTSEKAEVEFFNVAAEIPLTGMVDATALITSISNTLQTGATFPTAGHVVDVKPAGQWKLDATVINVPYFPVGYTSTSSSVHFANESGKVADVSVTAIDEVSGERFGPFDLGKDLPAYSVTKLTQGEVKALFSVTDTAKLSLTFDIDADKGDVNAYATVTSSTGRSEVSTSQQRN